MTTVSVCIPARNEAGTIEAVVVGLMGLVDRSRGSTDPDGDGVAPVVAEVVVVDDGSTDATARIAAAAGATVVANVAAPGKGGALRTAVAATTGDLVVFLDADVVGFRPGVVSVLVEPLVADPDIVLVKPRYRRSLFGQPDEGGRVTELMAKPLLARLFPALGDIAQPLAGETALRRGALHDIVLADGYGIEVALLIDVCRRFGRPSIGQVDLGERHHRNRPLMELRDQAAEVLDAVLRRAAG